MPQLLLVTLLLLVVSLTVGAVISVFRTKFWRERYEDTYSIYSETLDRALQSEREAERVSLEYKYLKDTINLIASRNSIAVLTDDQVRFISQTISQLVMAQAKPNLLN